MIAGVSRLKLICVIFFLASNLSCQKEKDAAGSVTNSTGGRCMLQKLTTDYYCIDFPSSTDSSTAQTTCTNFYNQYQATAGLNGISWLAGAGNTCAIKASTNRVGSCTVTSGTLTYYATYWTAGSAQTDCNATQVGTWIP